jgi:DNA gyrase subunit A
VLAGLRNLEDYSDRSGMRIAISLGRGADPQAVLDTLHAHTSLEATFAADLVAMVDGEPRRLTLRELIDGFLAWRDPTTVRSELSGVADRFGDERRTG